jgi:hypothetical protein
MRKPVLAGAEEVTSGESAEVLAQATQPGADGQKAGKGSTRKLAARKLAAAQHRLDAAVAEARVRAVACARPCNLIEFNLASFSDSEVCYT